MVELEKNSGFSNKEKVELASTLILSEELAKLAFDADPEVRIAIAYNPFADFNTRLNLAHDSDSRVRCAVADSEFTDSYLLAGLVDDSSYNVCIAAAYNKKTPPGALHHLYGKHECWYIRYSIACNENALSETLFNLVEDDIKNVREAALVTLEQRMKKIPV